MTYVGRFRSRLLLIALLAACSLTGCSGARLQSERRQDTSATSSKSIALTAETATSTTGPSAEVLGLDPSSPESLRILDTLRPQVEKALGQPVSLDVGWMNEWGDYATVQSIARDSHGREVDYLSIATYSEAVKAGTFDPQLYALLRRDGGRWRVLRWEVGATDVAWVPWSEEFRLPDDIWDMKRY